NQPKPSLRKPSRDHNRLVFSVPQAQRLGPAGDEILPDICCDRHVFRYHIYLWSRDHLLCRKPTTICPRNLSRWRALLASPPTKSTTLPRSINSKDLKRFGSAPVCISAIPMSAVCITWFLKLSIIRSTNIWPDFATRLT